MSIVMQTTFNIDEKSKISKFISGKTFRSDKEFIENIEDFLFWNIIAKWDKWDFIDEKEVFSFFDSKLWK